MKKALLTVLQVAVAAAILFFVFRDPAKRAQMAADLRGADHGWLLGALAVCAFSPVCALVRWGLLLRAQGIVLGWWRVAQVYFIGNFFNLFLLGSTGGDVIKIFYTLREAGKERRTAAFLTVVMDRVIGLSALIFLSCVFILTRLPWLTQTPEARVYVGTAGFFLGSALLGLTVTAVISTLGLENRLPARLPGRAKLVELADVLRQYRRSWRAVLAGFALSLPGHVAVFACAWMGARALGLRVPFLDISAVMPVVNTLVSMPISVAGLGVREQVSQDLLNGLCGVSKSNAVVLAEITFVCTSFYMLIGLIPYLLFRSGGGPAPTVEDSPAQRDALAAGMHAGTSLKA